MAPPFDPLTTNAADLQRRLEAKELTSVQIVETYLAQIETYNKYVNAFISITPRDIVVGIAAALDAERAAGSLRGPYQGIPIVLKDSIITSPELGMPTTVGSWVFSEGKTKGNAPLVQKLVDAGLIVLGKTNLSENCGFKTTWIMPGWSAYGGQTLSPYIGPIEEGEKVLGHSAPGGSSTGSAMAVASGFCPLSIGTETIGSVMVPASRAALYAIKPTIGSVEMKGVFSLCGMYDSVGPMAKTTADLVPVVETLLGRALPGVLQKNWDGLSVGFVDPKVWDLHESMCLPKEGTAEEMVEKYEAAVAEIRKSGGNVKYPVHPAKLEELTVDGQQVMMPISFWDFKNKEIPAFIAEYEECPVSSLADIVKYNEENKDKALPPPFPDQGDLVKAVENTTTEEEINKMKEGLRPKAIELLDGVFEKEGVDIMVGPTDGGLIIYAPAAGYPTANVPLGTLSYNGRPFGLTLIAKAGREDVLLRFMSAYEATFPDRPVPDMERLKDRVENVKA
ncbi:amidase signature enzyme [Thozetella sp. PMI_491]|nr:amidase signature enzyme [Thozetella sp. PMI_491]